MKTAQTILLQRIPTLVCYARDLAASVHKGTILFYHGLGAAKELHLAEIEQLTAAGFLVIAVDAVGHGQRTDPGLAQRIAPGRPSRSAAFQEVVCSTAAEIPFLLDDLWSRQWIDGNKIGIAGISMGGCIGFLAITAEWRFRVAVTILGTPEIEQASSSSPQYNLEKFSTIRLQSQNAARDEIVMAAEAHRFHAGLQHLYDDYDDRFEYIEYPDSGHFMEQKDWNRCIGRMVHWFDRHMP